MNDEGGGGCNCSTFDTRGQRRTDCYYTDGRIGGGLLQVSMGQTFEFLEVETTYAVVRVYFRPPGSRGIREHRHRLAPGASQAMEVIRVIASQVLRAQGPRGEGRGGGFRLTLVCTIYRWEVLKPVEPCIPFLL